MASPSRSSMTVSRWHVPPQSTQVIVSGASIRASLGNPPGAIRQGGTGGTVGGVRVVAGAARGRRLAVPPGRTVRPTSDRVREALFNALGSLDALRGASVLDLFAGSGALGIEALSRGAARATFVDSDAAALTCVRANLATCGFERAAAVVRGDAVSWAATGAHHDLALLDPPYAFDGWVDLLAAVDADLVVVESDREIALPAGWEVVRDRRYGTTFVRVARCLSRGDGRELR